MALDVHSITPEIQDYIAKNFLFSDQGFQYGDDASFLEEGIIDSLGIIELVSFVEKKFGVSVADHELLPTNFDSVAKLSAFITRKLAEAS
ncbi:MAG: acyl carrier protein [Acidobacteria bacterium]|nr:acyl carrier protein [Acidobacteriota bacterium]MBI3487713.1 acyl carrier protein [Acidobacteriota bacterium]